MDKETFVALVEAKSQMLFRVARAMLERKEDCDDALQESVLKAWASRHTLRDERYFATWITRIVIHECRNLQRRQRKYRLIADIPAARADKPPDPDLRHALGSLPEKLRLPIVLHYIEGYAVAEIAAMLRLPVTTVRNRLYAGRRQLRLDLNEEEALSDDT